MTDNLVATGLSYGNMMNLVSMTEHLNPEHGFLMSIDH